MTIKEKQQPIIDVFKALLVAQNDFKLYGKNHNQTIEAIDDLVKTVNNLAGIMFEINIDRVSNQWLILGYPVSALNNIGSALAEVYDKKHIARLTIFCPTDIDKVISLVEFLADKEAKEDILKGAMVAGVVSENADESNLKSEIDEEEDVETRYKLEPLTHESPVVVDMKRIYNDYGAKREVDVQSAKEISKSFVKAFSLARNPLKYLADVKFEDEYTYVHTINVSLLSMGLAIAIGLPDYLLNDITFAALMHDVGKMMIPNEILNFPGKLNDEDMLIMQSHALKGAIYLAGQNEMPRMTVIAALEHHLNYNGGGYPVIGEQYRPHVISQLISVADIYDALRSNRPYRKAMPNEKVLKIMREEAGTKLNPHMVDVFINLVNQWQ